MRRPTPTFLQGFLQGSSQEGPVRRRAWGFSPEGCARSAARCRSVLAQRRLQVPAVRQVPSLDAGRLRKWTGCVEARGFPRHSLALGLRLAWALPASAPAQIQSAWLAQQMPRPGSWRQCSDETA